MPVIIPLLAAGYLLAIYFLLVLAPRIFRGTSTHPRDLS